MDSEAAPLGILKVDMDEEEKVRKKQQFVETVPFEKRVAEANRIREKHPDRVPVICERAPRTHLMEIEKKKFLVPGTMLCGEFKYIVHKHINQVTMEQGNGLRADQTIYLFCGNKTPKTGATMAEIYENYRADDGFLYIKYSAENTLGCA
mmetsp:Transcript_24833/g.45569  ORF Transcript_24833/g.45569 Transcript_24833/m.45569 type:complete len:150 (-) Transcript_24833:125-574(-)